MSQARVESNDRCSDCVRLRLEPKPQESALEVAIDVNFDEASGNVSLRHHIFFKTPWKYKFGVREGELVCQLDNLTSPIAGRNFRTPLPTDEIVNLKKSKRTDDVLTKDDSQSLKLEVAALPKAIFGTQTSEREQTSQAIKIEESYQVFRVRIHEKGSESSPK